MTIFLLVITCSLIQPAQVFDDKVPAATQMQYSTSGVLRALRETLIQALAPFSTD